MLTVSANMSKEEEEAVQVEKNVDQMAITVSVSSLRSNFIIDFAALVRGPQVPLLAEPVGNEEGEEDEEGKATATDNEKRKRSKGRRREEAEEYDLDDPFIDDTELPPGGTTLQELYAMDINDKDFPAANITEGFGPTVVRPDDFYVWKGPLPTRQVSPLWLEKAMEAAAAVRAGSKSGKKRRRGQPAKAKASNRRKTEQSSNEEGDEQPGRKHRGSPKAKRAKKEKSGKTTTTEEAVETKRVKKRREEPTSTEASAKSKLSIMDRIVAMGDADEQTNETITMPSARKEEEEIERPVEGETHGEGEEERMRKRYDYTTPYLELEERLAMEAVKEAAARTDFTDPKKFPSILRPYVNEAIVCCLRRQERKDRLSDSFFTQLTSLLPFTPGSLEKLTYAKLIVLHRDELATKVIPQMLDELKSEAHALMAGEEETGKPSVAGEMGEANVNAADGTVVAPVGHTTRRFNEKIRQLLVDLVKCELDRQALDRMVTVQAGGRYASFSETSCRKAFYPKIASCWPEGPSTVEVAREYTTARRRAELRLLKEHHIKVQPTFVPIASHGKGGGGGSGGGGSGSGSGGKTEAGGERSTEEPSRVASQLDSQADQPEKVVTETAGMSAMLAPKSPLAPTKVHSPYVGNSSTHPLHPIGIKMEDGPSIVNTLPIPDQLSTEGQLPNREPPSASLSPLPVLESSFLETVMNATVDPEDENGRDHE